MLLPNPVWHQRVIDIDLEQQPDKLDDKYVKNGFHIYKSSWDDLRKVLHQSVAQVYSNNNIYSHHHDKTKVAKVIKNWNLGLQLIPPMLIHLENNTLSAVDGKHRLEVASIADPKEIYFILFDIDLQYINQYFSPQLID